MPPKKDKKKKAKKPTVTQRQTVIVNIGDKRRRGKGKPRAKRGGAMGGDFGTGGVSIIPSRVIRMNEPALPLPLQPTLPMIEPLKNAGDYSLLENRLQGVSAEVGRITGVVEDAIRRQQQQQQLQQATITELEEVKKRVGRPPISDEEIARRQQIKEQEKAEKARLKAELGRMRGEDKRRKKV